MSYEKQDFTDNTVLTAAQLNHMEEGIAAAEELAGKAGTDLTIGTVTTGDRAAASIEDGKLNLTLPRGEKGDSGTAASALTPEQFGAVGDGVANDTEAILAAAQAACEQGKHLSFSAGKTYLWSNGADFAALNGLYIEGNGAKVFAKDRVLLFRQMTNTTVEGLHFIASPSSAAMELIKIFECTGFKLLDCTLEWDLHDNIDSEHNILDVYRGNRDVLIRGCTLKQLTGTRAGGIWIREGKAGFIGQNIRIENCDIYKAGGDEVLAVWGWAGHLRDVTISNCNFIEVDDKKYAERGKDPAWLIGLNASEGDNIRFENCSIRTCRAGSTFRLKGEGGVVVDNCDIYNDSSKASHGHPLLQWTASADPFEKCCIQNSRITLKGGENNRIAYHLGRCINNQFLLDCAGKGFQSGVELRDNIFTGRIGSFLAQDTPYFTGNRVELNIANPHWQSGCKNISGNTMVLTSEANAQGYNIVENQPDGSVFANNKISLTVGSGDMRTYGFSSGTHYIYNNRIFTNVPGRIKDELGDVVYRKNNFRNDLPEKSFTCTGITLDPAELTENYMKKKEFNVVVTPENTTDPVAYAVTDPDGCLQMLRYGAYKPVKSGKVSLTATCGSYDAQQTITVDLVPVACESLRMTRKTALCAQNGTTCLRVVYSPYWTTDTLSWASSAPDVAEVDENGIITGKTLGKAVITATCGSLSDTCEITVVAESELPKYSEGEWLLDGKTAYIPLESIGAEHTLYLDIEVDSASLADGQSFGLFGTTTDGNPSFCTMAYMKDSSGHGFLSWATSDCSSDFDSGEKQSLYSSRSVSITEIEGTTVGTKLIFAPDGIYNLNGVRIWETSSQKVSLSTYSGKLYFNVASAANGKLTASALTGYKIKQLILYAHDTITTEREILQYRESADIDLRFTKDGQPVNAGTAGSIVISGDIPDAPRNTNPFPAIEAAYVLPEAKTFTPAAAECIDTGVKLFDVLDPAPTFTILLEADAAETMTETPYKYTLMYCMENDNTQVGLDMRTVGTMVGLAMYEKCPNFCRVQAIKAQKYRAAFRVKSGVFSAVRPPNGDMSMWGALEKATSPVTKSLILGARQKSDGTKDRFWDGTLYQCVVYKSALTDEQLKEWVTGG